jgi:gamma-glutamyltranspeptidase/glutathione hydrolase
VHLIAEAERLAYADRAQYLADSDYVPVPVKALTDPAYLASRALIGEHSMKRACPGQPQGADLALARPLAIAHLHPHLSAVDDSGQALAMTTSVEAAFGSHLMVKGFLLNNHLTDFSFIPHEHGKPVANRVQPASGRCRPWRRHWCSRVPRASLWPASARRAARRSSVT